MIRGEVLPAWVQPFTVADEAVIAGLSPDVRAAVEQVRPLGVDVPGRDLEP